MEEKEVGSVTPEERDEIKALFERKNGLIELSRSLASMSRQELDSSPLYEKVYTDLGKVTLAFQAWWDKTSLKYKWENIPGFKWEINFDACKIFLRKQ